MNIEIFIEVLRNSILITGLVLIMMLMIEYFNIHSQGRWFYKLQGSRLRQIFLGSFLGLIPGCIGGFAAVSLYTHRLIGLGALTAMMICSSGDEAFVILAMIPGKALLLFGILFVIAVIAGLITDIFIFKKPQSSLCPDNYTVHTGHDREIPSIFKASSYRVMKHPSKKRIAILAGIAVFIAAVAGGFLEHEHVHGEEGHLHEYTYEEAVTDMAAEYDSTDAGPIHFDFLNERWINLIFAGLSIITLLFTATADEHFVKEHLWNHVIRKHLLPIFLWTFGALLVCQIGIRYLDVQHWISRNMLTVILLAVAIGIIPESGPHLIFITLYAQGVLPFYVLIVNSIVQDGHTTLPLLAESKASFLKAKLINMIVGLIVGIGCWLFT